MVNREDLPPGLVWAALDLPPERRLDEIRLTVDGEVFDVWTPEDQPNALRFKWVSGPNDYGFTSSVHPADTKWTREMLEDAIRDFLEQIDPETGYFAED